MSDIQCDARGWFSIEGLVSHGKIEPLRTVGHIEKLSITNAPILTVGGAKLLSQLHSVSQLWLWCDVSRIAMRHVLQIPKLEILDVLAVQSPGRLRGFEDAESLHTLRANHCLTEADIFAISRCPSIRELGIQSSGLTRNALKALLDLPHLESLDLEGTPFTDQMAHLVSKSSSIQALDLGATRLTRSGLAHLVSMGQLRSLDLWATDLSVDDLKLLLELPMLEYLSVGCHSGISALNAEEVVLQLLSMASLKRVWLDGVGATEEQVARLEEKGLEVRVT